MEKNHILVGSFKAKHWRFEPSLLAVFHSTFLWEAAECNPPPPRPTAADADAADANADAVGIRPPFPQQAQEEEGAKVNPQGGQLHGASPPVAHSIGSICQKWQNGAKIE